jgi:formylglycine-generating enzyme
MDMPMFSLNSLSRVVFASGLAALLGSLAAPVHAQLAIDWVTVGDPGNAADTSGYGAVETSFQIMKYELTNQQYSVFLNSVAKTDTYSLYNPNMESDTRGGITRSGSLGSYAYDVKSNMGDKPVNYVGWFEAARLSNWMVNGSTSSSSTETGAYTLNGATSGDAPVVNPGSSYFIPTENQWYKAAYYKGGGTNAGYWRNSTQSDSAPLAGSADSTGNGSAGSTGSSANFSRSADWNGLDGNVTTVGTNGGPGAYGTFDMSGNVSEWNDLDETADSLRGIRGGGWNGSTYSLSSTSRGTSKTSDKNFHSLGIRLAAPVAVPEPFSGVAPNATEEFVGVTTGATISQVTLEMVTVGNPGNAYDSARVSGSEAVYGRVDYTYEIGKYDVTLGQYTAFLNAVDATGVNPHDIYNSHMATNPNIAGIAFDPNGAAGSKYAVISPAGFVPTSGVTAANRPVTYVSWFDAARFANWMTNGQGTGDTETGAYTLNGAITGDAVAANPGEVFRIPTENEWYKAAFYSPNYGGVGVPGYYRFATQSDSDPGNIIGGAPNQANYYIAPPGGVGFSVTEVDTRDDTQNYLTDGGAFSGSGSFYGTFDQSGNVYQWNDLDGAVGDYRGLRGGAAGINLTAFDLSYSNRLEYSPDFDGKFGFRLAITVGDPSAVPEIDPNSLGSVLALVLGSLGLFERRRLKAA